MLDEELNEQPEIKEEKPSENVEQEDEINNLFDKSEVIEKPTKDSKPYDEVIENARLDFEKTVKKSRIRSYVMMGVVLAIAIASVICIGFGKMVWTIVGWSLIGVAVVGMLVFHIITKNSVPYATKAYINVVNSAMNSRNFADNRFSETCTDKNEKIELADPISDAIYANISNIASRNVVNGKFDGRSFKVADMGLYSGAGKSRTSAFVGKYISYPNDLKFAGRYLISIKGKAPVDLPTDINDLEILKDEESLTIYGLPNSKIESDLGKDFMKELKKVLIERHLLNVNFVIWSGHSAVYASYDDIVMTLPYQKQYDKESNEQYADNLLHFFEMLSLLRKEK